MSTTPQFHGLLHNHVRKHIVIGLIVAAGAGGAFKFLVAEPRKKKYADFYKTYDPNIDNERMTKLGLFQSKQS
ncbi:cytochrome C oxidase subunit VIc-like [Tropilaelaps mercedesae]|uniref:Cytochrome C oxidase subunit VIc-like n=1 Tax=Tropilaelaps mercedesae TaxID=418985 RepID=A0A1V9XXF6_9ACAR|nr:cytochrome C oxidase subunit VIc-like [Tropilaelaps mercedesae]